MSGRGSQRKGRSAELELRDILNAAGFSSRALGIYEPFDLACDFGTGREELVEVKRRKDGMKPAYDAFANGAGAFFYRADRKVWLVVHTLDEYIAKHGPEFAGDRVGNEGCSKESCGLPSQDGATPSPSSTTSEGV